MIAFFIIAAIVIILDQLSKIIVSTNMNIYDSVTIIKGFAHFSYVRNDGIAWGIDAKLWILIIITIIAIGLFTFLARKLKWSKDKFLIITLGFMLGGTIGNFIDRLFQSDHSVIDFLDFYLYYPSFKDGFHFALYDFPIFNIADSFLVVGAIMFIIYFIIIEPKKTKKESNNNEVEQVEVVNLDNSKDSDNE